MGIDKESMQYLYKQFTQGLQGPCEHQLNFYAPT